MTNQVRFRCRKENWRNPTQTEHEQVNNQKRLEAEFCAKLNKFEDQRKRDEECRR
jgi:hypothetical protein